MLKVPITAEIQILKNYSQGIVGNMRLVSVYLPVSNMAETIHGKNNHFNF